jgi:CRISPR system Cascade subunit CasE
MYLLQFWPDMPLLMRWADTQDMLPRDGDDDLGYALHALLAAAFNKLAPKPFVLLRDSSKSPALLAYSQHTAKALRAEAATFALPEAIASIGLDTLADKIMPDHYVAGQRLGFRVRVRPTVRTDRAGDRTKVREIDAFLAAIADTQPGEGPRRDAVYRDWLTRRLAQGGAAIEQLSVDAFRLAQVHRRDRNRRLRGGPGPEATFTGLLSVRDPERFAALLARGVGRHRAFGFGMLLLRPA